MLKELLLYNKAIYKSLIKSYNYIINIIIIRKSLL